MAIEDIMLIISGCSIVVFGSILLYIKISKNW